MDCVSFVEAVVRRVGRRPAAVVCAAVLIACCAAPSRPAAAGVVVTKGTGKIEFGPSGSLGEVNSREFTANVPGAQTVDYNGTFGGIGQVSYDIAPTADQGHGQGLAADLTASLQSTGGPPVDGSSTFTLAFTSNLPIDYRFTAHLLRQGPQAFSAKLDGIVADARYNSLGEASGTIPHDENGIFGDFAQEGRLPAGAHTFTIESFATEIRSGAGATSGAASIRVTPVPLPAGAWTGLSVMSAMGLVLSLRRWRRRAAPEPPAHTQPHLCRGAAVRARPSGTLVRSCSCSCRLTGSIAVLPVSRRCTPAPTDAIRCSVLPTLAP